MAVRQIMCFKDMNQKNVNEQVFVEYFKMVK